jgi:hypothetical protein
MRMSGLESRYTAVMVCKNQARGSTAGFGADANTDKLAACGLHHPVSLPDPW